MSAGQADPEGGPSGVRVGQGQGPVVAPDDVAGDGQAKAGSALVAAAVEVVDARGTEREFTVDATDGTVTATGTAKGDDSDDDAALTKSARTDVTRAVNAALARIKGTATAAELEGEHGTPVWHIDVTDARGHDHEVTVGARSGKVTAAEADDDHRHGGSDDHDDDHDDD